LSEKLDILLGGFPCQAFSIAGERKGFEDDRGNLFLSIINLINKLQNKFGDYGINGVNGKPRILFLENVKNLKGHDGGRTYEVIKSELEKTGYTIKEHVLNTMDYSDLPQNRERIYIIGFLNQKDADKFNFFDDLKSYKKAKSKEDRVRDIKNIINYDASKEEYEKYYYTKAKYPGYFLTEDEYNEIPADKRKAERVNLDEQINEMYEFYQVRRGMYVRKNMSGVCPTLTANMGTGGHNVPLIKVKDGIRKITPEEAFKLQGFPVGNGLSSIKYKGKNYLFTSE
jgi:DNA (cytosine-5)-methyltransferase 1